MRPFLLATAEGTPVLWYLANPKHDECEVTAALVEADRHLIADGQVVLADGGQREHRSAPVSEPISS